MTLGGLLTLLGDALRGLAVGIALVSAGACATGAPVARISTPPVELMADCPEPSSSANTNGELVTRFVDMRGALRACNVDKRALRRWAEEVQAENP